MLKSTDPTQFLDWIQSFYRQESQLTIIPSMRWMGDKTPSIYELLKNLQQSLDLDDSILIAGLCFMKRTVVKGLQVQQNSVYKLALVCLFIAHKFYNDFHLEVEEFSVASGVRSKNIVDLEGQVLGLLNYDLVLSERDYFDVLMFTKF